MNHQSASLDNDLFSAFGKMFAFQESRSARGVAKTSGDAQFQANGVVSESQQTMIDNYTLSLYLPPKLEDRITWATTTSIPNAQHALNRRARVRDDAIACLLTPSPIKTWKTYATDKYLAKNMKQVLAHVVSTPTALF